MSVLSSQCDNLRIMARLVREYGYSEISKSLRDAADTIWSLRDRIGDMTDELVKLRGDNAKLRELATEAIRLMQADGPDCGLCKHYSECWADEAMNYSPSGCVICNEARELGIEVGENAKLRELMQELLTDPDARERMRELGIEVSE